MKKITAFLLIICMLFPPAAFATAENTSKIYIFGDDWAVMWGEELKSFTTDLQVVNCAGAGQLMSGISKTAGYSAVTKDDVVLLSYGILEKDRKGDNNGEFKKILENTVGYFQKKGASVYFVSICSTMRYNSLTNRMEETKNFYTEAARAFAREKGIEYVDLAAATASWANELGSNNASEIYLSNLALTKRGNKLCAYEVYETIQKNEKLKGKLKNNLSYVYTVPENTYYHSFNMFYEKEKCDGFAVYIKGGVNAAVNSIAVADGDSVTMCDAPDGKIDVSFTFAEKIQIAPVYKFEAAGCSTTQTPFTGSIYPGTYDVSVKKSEPLKASVYLNDYLVASNLDMPGTQPVTEAAEHTFTQFNTEDKNFAVRVKGLTDKLEYIYFRESAVIYGEKPKIFLGGDSTVCNYYPLMRTGDEIDGTVMTGWGMMLSKYVDAEVVNLAASGDWAANWLANSFPVVEKEGKRGDIFIVQFGINDHDMSTVAEMKSALNEMIDRCAAKGIIPILVSPQISAGYGWGENSNVGKSDGGAYEEFFSAVRDLSVEKNCFYVDLTDLSSGWFSEVGRDEVYKKYHLWDYENNCPKDMMHLSCKGADAMCRFFVMGLKRMADSKQTDAWGNSLDLLKIW